MMHDTDIAIVGGGLNGTALALALVRTGHAVTLIDSLAVDTRAGDRFDGRSYAIAQGSKRLLDRLGLWDRLAPDAQPMHKIMVTDGKVGDSHVFLGLDFSSHEIEEGPMGFMVEDRHLRRALLDAVAQTPGITHLAGETVTAQTVDAERARLTLASGKTLTTRLVIGADGRRSGTAARAGITRTGWDYPQTALVCAIDHDKPHHGIAHQVFLPAGPLAILPLTGNRSSIVWSEKRDLAPAINALPEDKYLQVLRPRFGDFLGDIRLAGDRYTYPLNLTLANAMTAPRLALVGDAAHGMHPIAGQGLNAGLRDVAALAHVIDHAARRGEDIASPQVLSRYAEWRRWDVASLAAATDVFNRLFSNANPLLRAVRDLGMAAVQAAPSLRRGFIREAAGLTGELPDLMRG